MTHPLDAILERYKDRQDAGGYIVLANVKGVEGEPLEVGPGLRVRKASMDQRTEIIRLLEFYLGPREMHHLPWEHELQWVENGRGGQTINFHPVTAEDHRHHVLEFEGTNVAAHRFIEAAVLGVGPTLMHGISLHWGKMKGAGGAAFLSQAVDDLRWKEGALVTLTEAHVSDIADLCQRFITNDESITGVRRGVGDFNELDRPSLRPGLRLLGYFGILESLLVHKPLEGDPYSSISRQMKMKMKLLAKRLARPTDLTIGGLSVEKTWGALYELRSLVAHGTRPDFEKGAIANLKSVDAAVAFVREVTRSVMRQALEEPLLIADLKEC